LSIKYIAIEFSLLFMIYDNVIDTKVIGESSNYSCSIINCCSISSSCAAAAAAAAAAAVIYCCLVELVLPCYLMYY